MKLYVSNLPFDAGSNEVKKLFAEFGKIDSAEVVVDRETRASRGFAIVKMASDEEGRDAIDGLDGRRYRNCILEIVESRPPVRAPRSNWGTQFQSPLMYFHNNGR